MRAFACDDLGLGTAVVLVHGFPLDRSIWASQRDALAASARVICVDLPGCGETPADRNVTTMDELADGLAVTLDTLGIRRAIVVGHSIGSYISIAFARRHRDRVAGFAMVAGHFAADGDINNLPRASLIRAIEGPVGVGAAVASYLPHYFAPHVYTERPALVETARAIMERIDPRGAVALIRAMASRAAGDDVRDTLAAPAALVAGEEDYYIPAQRLRDDAARMTDGVFVGLPRVGHLPMLEAPEATTAALRDLLARVEARAS